MAKDDETNNEEADEAVLAGVPVGTKVWYYLRADPIPEWIEAEVTDGYTGPDGKVAMFDTPFSHEESDDSKVVHLKIALNRRKHYSASSVGYRQNVVWGSKPGQWLKAKPKGADDAYAQSYAEHKVRQDLNVRRARGEDV